MKKITLLRKALKGFLCTGIAGAFSVTAWAQPTVTVPPDCEVVEVGTGTGTSLGFGGTVGSGGIVTMPDPFPNSFPPNCTFTINPGSTNADSWVLAGDLSIFPRAYNLTPIQTASGSTANIMSYNKSVRQTESAAQGRSIGMVTIPYDDTLSLCSGGISFKVYKVYSDSLPIIIGPECWLPDSTYTYSVDQIASDNLADGIGLDMYYWTIVDDNGDTLYNSQDNTIPPLYPDSYTSADKSSITTKVPSTLISPYTITCCFGRANPWDGNTSPYTHTSCVTKTIGAQPTQPIVNFIGFTNCVPVGDNSFTATITSPNLGYNYHWESDNAEWSLNANTLGDTIILTTLGNNPGTLTLTVSNGNCGSEEFEYFVGRSLRAPDAGIDSTIICLSEGQSYTYSIFPSNASLNQVEWILPTGWTINTTGSITNNTLSIIELEVPIGAGGSSYTLQAFSCSENPGDTVSLVVNVRPENPVADVGTNCLILGSTAQVPYSVTPAGTYQWSFPTGWSGSSTTESIMLTPDGITGGTVSVYAVGIDGCDSEDTVIWITDFSPVIPDTFDIVSCWNFGFDALNTIRVSNTPSPLFYGTYIVNDPTGILFTDYSVDTDGNIILETNGNAPAGTYTIEIQHATGCDTSAIVNIPITFTSNGFNLTKTSGMGYDEYIVGPGLTPVHPVNWYLDNVLYIGNTPPYHTLYLFGPPPAPNEVCAEVIIAGCTTVLCEVGGPYGKSLTTGATPEDSGIKVFPNPNKGTFNIQVDKFKEAASLQIVDVQGRIINEHILSRGENTITENISSGTYLLLINVDGKNYPHKIEVDSGR